MEKRILIGFLFASCVAAFSVEEEEFTGLFTPTDYALFSREDRLHVFDDDGNLIEITDEDIEVEELTDDNIAKRVLFYLFTSKESSYQIYVNDMTILKKSGFDPKKPTYFVTHGWMNSGRSAACTLIRDAYLQHGDCNVIVIDWSDITFRPYFWAGNQVKKVALFISQMCNFLEKNGMNMSTTVMAGHSLGAHVVGLAARNCNGTVSYVVGLDPALPNFMLAGPGSRISDSDANYVEIIHTNAGLLGYYSAIGHADYYPNGGKMQPGCLLKDVGGACSHARSFRFFAESINNPTGFVATRCNNYVKYMSNRCRKADTATMGGIKTSFEAKGVYYLSTASSSPFAKGK